MFHETIAYLIVEFVPEILLDGTWEFDPLDSVKTEIYTWAVLNKKQTKDPEILTVKREHSIPVF